MIEALGVPHTEVELILVQGESAGFGRLLQDGDRVAVYPRFEALDITPLLRLRERPLRVTRVVADAHLAGLARLLRMAGFDTLYRNDYEDSEIADVALREGRIVLTRDRELLKLRGITHGCYIHAQKPAQRFRELLGGMDLTRSLRPFTPCAWTATHRCGPSTRRKCSIACRPPCARTTSASPPAIFAAASSGRARTGSVCAD